MGSLDKMGSQLVPEVLDSVVSPERVPVEEWFVPVNVSMKPVLQREALFAGIENCKIKPILNKFFVLEAGSCPIIGWWNF